MIKADFIFHNIGQGLFYSGHIKCGNDSFDFVYDCGGKNITTTTRRFEHFLEKEDKNDNKKILDLLVISHFHTDHFNGISKLLEKVKVNHVIIPFYTFAERMEYLLSVDSSGDDFDNYLEFLQSPYKYLLNICPDIKSIIVMVRGNKRFLNDNPIDILNPDKIDKKLIDTDILGAIKKEEKDGLDGFKTTISVINDSSIFNFKKCWYFAFYADESFRSKFNQYGVEKELNALKNNIPSQIKKELRNIKKKYNLNNSELNEASLMLLHRSNKKLNLNRSSFENNNFIHFLTGDFNFNKTSVKIVKKHFQNFCKDYDVLVLQVPHHGSKDNWNKELIINKKFNICVIPYGVDNRYGHPAISVLKDIKLRHRCFPVEVTENNLLILNFLPRHHKHS